MPFSHPSLMSDPHNRSVRSLLLEPTCSKEPSLTFQGAAQDVTSTTLRKRMRSPRFEIMRAGNLDAMLSHEFEPGWPPALRLKQGQNYSVELYSCDAKVASNCELPSDKLTDDGIIFYSMLRALKDRKDDADMRRTLRGYVGLWTDGLMISCRGDVVSEKLKVGRAYKVVVRRTA